MCGIATIFAYRFDAPGVERDELIAIRDRMSHRGPDGEGIWISDDRRVGLAHRRLTIIDLSENGAQPMWNHDRTLCITFNGEIYNYQAIRAKLESRGYQFRSTSDTEVILQLYADRGAEMVHELRGMYAFAIWDDRKRSLFLVRDPFGIKPLYYADDGQTIRVASQVKALLPNEHIDTSVDPAGHVSFFLWGAVPDPFTLYRGISALPAGHSLTISENGDRQSRSFCFIPDILRTAESGKDRQAINPDAQRELLHRALRDSAEHHLVADVPVGIFLSAGLDSSTITSLVSEAHPDVRTVTLGFHEYRGSEKDETRLAEVVAKNCRTNHQTIWITRDDFQLEIDKLFTAMDRPSIDGVNTYFVSLAAKRTGLKVALSGLGGDELFAGYPSFHDVPRLVHAMRYLQPMSALGRTFRAVSSKMLRKFTSPKYAGIFEYGSSYPGAYLLRRSLFMPWELPNLLDPDLVREGWRRLNTFDQLAHFCDSLDSARLKLSALELCWYMRHQLLRDSDWAGMAHSLEIRVPFVDVDLLRSLAPLLAQPNPPSKRDMANSLRSKLPNEILNRPKTGFTVPVREWLLEESRNSKVESRKWKGASPARTDRGLRGWAKHVYAQFPGAQLAPTARRGKMRSQPPARQSRFGGGARSEEISASQSFGVSDFQRHSAPSSPLPAPGSQLPCAKRILVFRIGQLGDTIVSLPAMWAVRRNFPNAHLALLSDRHPGKRYVLASDLLQGAGIFDEFLSYPVEKSGELLRGSRMALLLATIRQKRFDTLVYLAPTNRKPEQIARDRRFFSLAGIKNFIGMDGFPVSRAKKPGVFLEEMPHESELLLDRLSASGLTIRNQTSEVRDQKSGGSALHAPRSALQAPSSNLQSPSLVMDLGLGPQDEDGVGVWLRNLESDGDRPWIAVGPGSKMPAKRWPLDRFEQVATELIHEFDIWPVVFGGGEDRPVGEKLLQSWGRGYNAAGALGIRPALAAMKRCTLFLGNDTGTMHMAAAVGVLCVAVFSSRVAPGLWFPEGKGHRVFYSHIECEGCGLVECVERQNECLKRIGVVEVTDACRDVLSKRLRPKESHVLSGAY